MHPMRASYAVMLVAAALTLLPLTTASARPARAAPVDACRKGVVAGQVLRSFFAAVGGGDVSRAASLLSTPPDVPADRRWYVVLTYQTRDLKRVIRRDRLDVDDAAAKRRWLRARMRESDRLRLLDLELGDATRRPLQRMYPGLLFERRADDLSGTVFYGGKAGIDCVRRKIIFIYAGARRGVGQPSAASAPAPERATR